MNKENQEKLFIVFTIENDFFCIASHFIDFIADTNNIIRLPEEKKDILGFLKEKGHFYPVIELRRILGKISNDKVLEKFAQMKKLHLDWVEELRESVIKHTPFHKPTDPHQCSFGKWYDNFHTDNSILQFLLKQICYPHEKIHSLGACVNQFLLLEDFDNAAKAMEQAHEICTNQMVPLLDKLIEAYRNAFSGMVLCLDYQGEKLGLLVDEIKFLLPENTVTKKPLPTLFKNEMSFCSILEFEEKITLELNVKKLFEIKT